MSSLLNIAASSSSSEFYGFDVTNSLRFDDGSTANLQKTPSGAGSLTTWTWSAWVKRGDLVNGTLWSANFNSNQIGFTSNQMFIEHYDGSANNFIRSSKVLRDTSAWYNLVFVWDTSNSTQADRMRMYCNGLRITALASSSLPTQNRDSIFNSAVSHEIGRRVNPDGLNFDGYMTEINFIDGQALDASSFGETKSGVWIPKDTTGLTYGTNGYRLEFKQTGTGTASSSTIGADTSGQTNHYTSNNLSAHDVVPDSPTNNYAVLNPINTHVGATHSEGNLSVLHDSGGGEQPATFAISSGKWYWEVKQSTQYAAYGLLQVTANPASSSVANGYHWYGSNGLFYTGTTSGTNLGTFADPDVISLAYNADDNELTLFKNGVSAGTESIVDGEYFPDFGAAAGVTSTVNFGQNGTFNGLTTAGGNTDANGQGNFKYSVPSGFLALNSANLPEPTITPLDDDIPEDYFETNIWTGNGSSQSISSYEFAPDWVWIKERSNTSSHYVVDTVRGANLFLQTNSTVEDTSNTVNVTSFDSNGFSLGNGGTTNQSGEDYVGWAWLAGTAFSNDASATSVGTIDSSGQVNTKAGFSIISYTGAGSTETVAHGLSSAPEIVLHKNRTDAADWEFITTVIDGSVDFLRFTTAAKGNSSRTAPTSTVFEIGSSTNQGASGKDYIAYCFHSVEGYSKFGFYTGNGNTDGVFVFTGFRPAMIIVKQTDASNRWLIFDNKRGVINPLEEKLELNPDDDSKESTSGTDCFDFLSNGFKLRRSGDVYNGSGHDYIYMAFAEMPFKYANAR